MFFVCTYKYFANGETYIFSTEWQDCPIDLNANAVEQEIIIDEGTSWNNQSYAIYLTFDKGVSDKEGYLHLQLIQNGAVINEANVSADWLETGFFELKWLDFSKLSPGRATVAVEGVGLNFTVQTGLSSNIFGLPNCYLNGEDTGSTLVQQYHYNLINRAYKIGMLLYLLLIVISIVSVCILLKIDNEKYTNLMRIHLIITYIILVYGYDKSLFFEPTWAEAVTNYMHNSLQNSVWNTIMITDAGYLPLFQRLIAILCFDILHMSAYVGVYAIQIIAYVVSGWIFSFFMRKEFSDVANRKFRYIFCLLLMILVINQETGSIINFMTYGILVIFLYFLADSDKWSNWMFAALCIGGGCMFVKGSIRNIIAVSGCMCHFVL